MNTEHALDKATATLTNDHNNFLPGCLRFRLLRPGAPAVGRYLFRCDKDVRRKINGTPGKEL
jgi:hypothetical protein